jgi:hypothetical protein
MTLTVRKRLESVIQRIVELKRIRDTISLRMDEALCNLDFIRLQHRLKENTDKVNYLLAIELELNDSHTEMKEREY